MPELCRFYGIIITMYYREHAPPHFHATYGSDTAEIGISPLAVLKGRLPPRAMALVIEWASRRQQELSRAWELRENRRHPGKIAPLD